MADSMCHVHMVRGPGLTPFTVTSPQATPIPNHKVHGVLEGKGSNVVCSATGRFQ